MIPKTLHLCWLSADPFPALIDRCIASWKDQLPDYEIMLWDGKRFDLDGTPWVREAFARRKYAFAADYIRLHALYHHGGIYLDADVEVVRSLDGLLHHQSFIGYESSGDLEPAIIGAHPGAAWVGACLQHYAGRHFVLPDGSLDMRPLPLIVAEVLHARYPMPAAPIQAPQALAEGELVLFPARFFSPKNPHTGKVRRDRDTHTVHHFDGQWVDKNWQHGAKRLMHNLLTRSLGEVGHRKVVDFVRRRKG